MELKHIAEILKEHELYCYRIAYYLIEQEEFAIVATKQALIELGQDESFFVESVIDRRKRAKKVVTRHSLNTSLCTSISSN